jgi:hypothetical protein
MTGLLDIEWFGSRLILAAFTLAEWGAHAM